MIKGGKIINEEVELPDSDLEDDFGEQFTEGLVEGGEGGGGGCIEGCTEGCDEGCDEPPKSEMVEERGVIKIIFGICEKVRDGIAKSIKVLQSDEWKSNMKKRCNEEQKRKPSEIEKWGAIGLLALGMNGDAILKRIADSDKSDFYGNFNYSLYKPFSPEKLAETRAREEAKFNPEEVKFALESLSGHELNFVFSDVFNVKDTALGCQVSLNLLDQKGGAAFIGANGFIPGEVVIDHVVSRDGEEILFTVKGNDVDLTLAQDRDSIEIIDAKKKNNVLLYRNAVGVAGVVNDKSHIGNKNFFVAEGGGVLISQRYEYQVFLNEMGNEILISDADSLISFMKECSSRTVLMRFFEREKSKMEGDGKVDMRQIESMSQLIEILRLIGDDDEMYQNFMGISMAYFTDLVENTGPKRHAKELPFEGYRHPLLTLKIGGGDCDDFTMLNYLRAHVNGHEPYVVRVSYTWFNLAENIQDAMGHVFVAYGNKEGELVVFDNDSYTNLGKDGTIQLYMEERIKSGNLRPGTKIDWARNF